MKTSTTCTPTRRFQKGVTMIEMIVVMFIFSIFIMLLANSFGTIMKYSSRFTKGEESNIEGVVGLEMLRHDIESAGYGLATSFSNNVNPTYLEATTAPPNLLNDAGMAPPLPRAIVGLGGKTGMLNTATNVGSDGSTYTTLAGSDYLTIKSASLGIQDTQQKWTYITYSSVPAPPKVWTSGNLINGDQVIVLRRSIASSGLADYQLVFNPGTPNNYWTTFASAGLPPIYSPATASDINYVYGIAASGNLGMPFNRADYFVATPNTGATTGNLPVYCAPHTGILYKALVNHADGKLLYQPILDCVARMQVVLGWSMLDSGGNVITSSSILGTGAIDTWTSVDGNQVSSSGGVTRAQMIAALADPGQIRTKLKVVKIYILAQNGKLDTSYTSLSSYNLYDPLVEGSTPGSTYTLTSDMLNYRWKVYELMVRPKNLQSNQ
ncbi:MAG: prepilin-type N-terminal cleavage/methylation domain-containing protein [Oryzomonas sp.]|uniref:PulJ/GspJ family protein n=1 Tax=Oryzomonas sp. TaxID=2855186 RepID=UPI0028470B57|nr:prepilin-type N-terminal cleavage/methylation domain-containing protein [Oryzomonas sp.]MDR3580929.1 prepilin-type N-terminal cleavage/methylation domain-containing protein [Oryzomonas sp.]